MGENQADVDYVERWVALFNEAAHWLRRERFNWWLLGVGSSGTYEERCRAGEAILELLKAEYSPLTRREIYRVEKQPVNAISPDAGGVPYSRGVR